MLDQLDRSPTGINVREETCERVVLETRRKPRIPLDGGITDIAAFPDCRVRREKNNRGEFRSVFSGLSPDVTVAQYVTDLVLTAMHTEVERFKRTKDYLRYHPDDRRTVSTSFLHGMAASASETLIEMKRQRDA